jgi:hypothetical protein
VKWKPPSGENVVEIVVWDRVTMPLQQQQENVEFTAVDIVVVYDR